MVKKWSEFNESKIRDKINLLRDLTLELSDLGLYIDIWNGTISDDYGTSESDVVTNSKSIIVMIQDVDGVLDSNGYYEDKLMDKKEIIDLEKSFVSYGMIPRRKSGFSDIVYFFFNKSGKMTDSDILK